MEHGPSAERYCDKDPFVMKYADHLLELFPASKFVLMVRDGRASVHSMITAGVTITNFDLSDPRQCLSRWNQAGEEKCLIVHYEQLVLHTEPEMRRVLEFLDLEWNDNVLHHEDFVGEKIKLSSAEKSSDQVVRPVNEDSLYKWTNFYSADVINDMSLIAPMLAKLGYDPTANPPNYGTPDDNPTLQAEELIELHPSESLDL
uniref:Protein-tyrosine sulfotransferase n=1 Tax=Steinernema glaseri TaxID=37863 RepID=A0A1I8A8Z7_9BILA